MKRTEKRQKKESGDREQQARFAKWTLQNGNKCAKICSLLCIVAIFVVPLQSEREGGPPPTPSKRGLNKMDKVGLNKMDKVERKNKMCDYCVTI